MKTSARIEVTSVLVATLAVYHEALSFQSSSHISVVRAFGATFNDEAHRRVRTTRAAWLSALATLEPTEEELTIVCAAPVGPYKCSNPRQAAVRILANLARVDYAVNF